MNTQAQLDHLNKQLLEALFLADRAKRHVEKIAAQIRKIEKQGREGAQ